MIIITFNPPYADPDEGDNIIGVTETKVAAKEAVRRYMNSFAIPLPMMYARYFKFKKTSLITSKTPVRQKYLFFVELDANGQPVEEPSFAPIGGMYGFVMTQKHYLDIEERTYSSDGGYVSVEGTDGDKVLETGTRHMKSYGEKIAKRNRKTR